MNNNNASALATYLASQYKDISLQKKLMIYGANGTLGRKVLLHICKDAPELIKHVILAGRNATKIQQLLKDVREFKECDAIAFNLDHVPDEHLKNVSVLLNCAGPYRETAMPMIGACLRNNICYVDANDDFEVLETLLDAHELNNDAMEKRIAIVPSCGYDSLPNDCLTKQLYNQYVAKYGNAPYECDIAINPYIGTSLGVAEKETLKQLVSEPAFYRHKDHLQKVPFALVSKDFLFQPPGAKKGEAMEKVGCISVPWSDLTTAYYTMDKKVPNISVYLAMNRWDVPRRLLHFDWIRYLFLLVLPYLLPLFLAIVNYFGTSESQGQIETIVQMRNKAGDKKMQARMLARDGYDVASQILLASAVRLLSGHVRMSGILTPSKAFGEQFIDKFDCLTTSVE